MKILELNQENLEILKSKLNAGYPIIVPTDTNYNLCCLPDNRMAINRIFEYKIRPKNKPLSIFMSNPNDWEKYGKTSQTNLMKLLVDEFWPGALNIVVENISPFHYAINDSSTISLGCVQNEVFREFVEYLGGVVAITSANISGTADNLLITEEVADEHMGDKVDYLLKSNVESLATKSSTIIKVNDIGTVTILREGDISKKEIQNVLQKEGYVIEK